MTLAARAGSLGPNAGGKKAKGGKKKGPDAA
jgi:hypothetical protein